MEVLMEEIEIFYPYPPSTRVQHHSGPKISDAFIRFGRILKPSLDGGDVAGSGVVM
jgi:hypothetical protein